MGTFSIEIDVRSRRGSADGISFSFGDVEHAGVMRWMELCTRDVMPAVA